MRELTYFYLELCPYCQRAQKYMDELMAENPKYASIPIRRIEESEERDLASQYDYYYVPCFFMGQDKIAEGAMDKQGVQTVLEKALEE